MVYILRKPQEIAPSTVKWGLSTENFFSNHATMPFWRLFGWCIRNQISHISSILLTFLEHLNEWRRYTENFHLMTDNSSRPCTRGNVGVLYCIPTYYSTIWHLIKFIHMYILNQFTSYRDKLQPYRILMWAHSKN